jgi:hypothetical protein
MAVTKMVLREACSLGRAMALLVVARDLSAAVSAGHIAPTMQEY